MTQALIITIFFTLLFFFFIVVRIVTRYLVSDTTYFMLLKIIDAFHAYSKLISFFFIILFFITLISSGCLLWAEKDFKNSLDSSTISQLEKKGGTINSYYDSLYLTWISLTTIGYGDFAPISPTGKIICLINSLISVIFLGGIIVSVCSIVVSLISPSRICTIDEYENEIRNLDHKGTTTHIDKPNSNQNL